MPRISPDPIMPNATLESFPWKNLLYTWDFGLGYGRNELRIRLWNVLPDEYEMPFRELYAVAHARHLEMWDWLALRHELVRMPEFDLDGNVFMDEEEQCYDRFAIWSIFHLGPERPWQTITE
jgi:hypothetical protein